MALVSEEQKRKIHIRNTDFFLKNFKNVGQDIEVQRIKEIIDIELQCLGYGVFKPKELLDNFIKYILDLLKLLKENKSQVKSLKIILNGFTLDPKDPVLQRIADKIPQIKQNLNVLYIHTSNLKNTDLQDFDRLLRLSHDLGDINFQQFSLQCANWSFHKKQPSFKDLHKIFQALIADCNNDITKLENKRFRLQISGWYYNTYDAKAFLGFKLNEDELKKVPKELKAQYAMGEPFNEQRLAKERQNFFKQMQYLIKGLLEVMNNIEQLELDLRNGHDLLKFKDLKKILDNVTKENRTQKSIMSKRNDVQADQAQKELNLNIVV